jgi:hypothetical protein
VGAEAPVNAESTPELVRFRRSGGGQGGYNELLEIGGDGTFAMDRRYSGTRAGAFAGRLGGGDDRRLRQLVDAATADQSDTAPDRDETVRDTPGAPPPAVQPESSNDRIELVATARTFDIYDEPDGPWGELLALLRDLLETLVDQPRAALELAVGGDAPRAVLRHAGTEPVVLADAPIDASATLLDDQSATRGSWHRQIDVAAGEVGPGWELDLGLDSTAFVLEPATGYTAAVSVRVVVDGGPRTWQLHAAAGEVWQE